MSGSAFTRRVNDFKTKFQSLLGAKSQGYDELDTLERPLFSAQDETDDYERTHGVAAPQSYRPPNTGGATGAASFTAAAAVPSQVDEIRELSVLAKDAAGILWEMVALGETGPAATEMRSTAEQLQAQLRGLIGDYTGGDEALFSQAFEALDMLNSCLADPSAAQQERRAAHQL
ncbi:hypothetical protein ACKKBG_A13540 [Auxenochlorella protothecoides x Auxenochlorella symbiontica]